MVVEVVKLFHLKGLDVIPDAVYEPEWKRNHMDPGSPGWIPAYGGIDIEIDKRRHSETKRLGEIIDPQDLEHIPSIIQKYLHDNQ